jgi:hypothetical protein
MAWPMEEPTATPLSKVSFSGLCLHGEEIPRSFAGVACHQGKKKRPDLMYGVCNLRSCGSHLPEKTGAGALLDRSRSCRSLGGSGRVGSGRVRLVLLAVWRVSRLGRSGSRTSGSAARRSRGGSGTTALTRHVDYVVRLRFGR